MLVKKNWFHLICCGNYRGAAFIIAWLFYFTVGAQTSTTETFGQNRVQYKDFTFQYYESDNFITYFYQGGQDIAKYVIKTAEDDGDEISKTLDFRYKKKIDIIVYNSITELNQTNIGIYEPNQNPGGTIKIPEGKIFIYFNGDHRNLEKQIREGIAKIYVDKMVRGTGIAEAVPKCRALLNLPDWYKFGMEQYIAEDWNSDMEDHLRDGILSGRYKKLKKLKPEEAIFVGHSIWHYIEETHGKAAVNNIFYLTRINRSVENGFMFVLGTGLTQTLKDWYAYYYTRFNDEAKTTSLPSDNSIIKTRIRKNLEYYEPKISPDGKYVAYASNDMGRYKVHLINTETGKKKVIMRGGFRTNTIFTDNSIPLMAWDPSGKRLAMIREKRANILLYFYDIEKRKKEINPVRKFQKVVSFGFVDSKQLVLSAMQNGQTDIFLYTIASTTTRKITDDYFDDLYPAYIKVGGMRGIMFSSNRTDDTLVKQRYESQVMNNKQLDLFFYDLDANGNVLYRVTSTPMANETYPQNLNDSSFTFLSDANGVRNRYIGHFQTVFDHNEKTYRFTIKESGETDSVSVRQNVPLDSAIDRSAVTLQDSSLEKVYKISGVTADYTDYTHSILEQSISPNGWALDLFKIKNKFQFRKYNVESTASGNAPVMGYMQQLQRGNVAADSSKRKKAEKPTLDSQTMDSIRANRGKHGYDFQSEFDYGIKLFDWDSVAALKLSAESENGYIFRFSKVRPYFVRFMVDNAVIQLNNNPIVTRYQPFDPASPAYIIPTLGPLFQIGITDLLEDYKLYGGVEFPFQNISGNNQFFLTYEYLKKRLDQKYTFYRSSQTNTTSGQLPFTNTLLPAGYNIDYSIKTYYLEAALKYPLDVLNSFRFIFSFRNENVIYKAEDDYSLNLPNSANSWLGERTEYVFDDCLEVMSNIRYGTRFKVFAEVQKEFPTEIQQLSGQLSVPLPTINNQVLGIIGFDLRHYIKIYKQIIWANRLSGAGNFGNAKMIYYLGGLDNWLTSPSFNKFDYNTPIDYNNNYAFQTLATPLRGFLQNARNGDKYLLLNSELRIPIFSALVNSTIKSAFIRDMQLLAFIDAGTAWEGVSPYSNTNPLYTEQLVNPILNPSVIANLTQYKTPILVGFGPGISTTLLGYFIKFDVAWGYDTGIVSQKPLYYLSLGYDF